MNTAASPVQLFHYMQKVPMMQEQPPPPLVQTPALTPAPQDDGAPGPARRLDGSRRRRALHFESPLAGPCITLRHRPGPQYTKIHVYQAKEHAAPCCALTADSFQQVKYTGHCVDPTVADEEHHGPTGVM